MISRTIAFVARVIKDDRPRFQTSATFMGYLPTISRSANLPNQGFFYRPNRDKLSLR